jgi:DDE superfamily endonuclease
VQDAIEAAGAMVRYLPQYSPDLNPIEMPFNKVKAFLRNSLSGPFVVCASGSARSCQSSAAPMSQLLQACRLCIHMIGICSNLAGTPLLAR